MKIVNRKTFLSLPLGTVYCEHYPSDGFGEIMIKYNTCQYDGRASNDLLYMPLGDFDDHGSSEERYAKIDKMVDEGAEYPLRLDSVGRTTIFDDHQLFCIYSKEDVLTIITKLKETLDGQ